MKNVMKELSYPLDWELYTSFLSWKLQQIIDLVNSLNYLDSKSFTHHEAILADRN